MSSGSRPRHSLARAAHTLGDTLRRQKQRAECIKFNENVEKRLRPRTVFANLQCDCSKF